MLILSGPRLYAAVGCDLNDPDRDVKRLFPGSTGFKTLYISIDRRGGKPMLQRIEHIKSEIVEHRRKLQLAKRRPK